jgi:hypothetical protein
MAREQEKSSSTQNLVAQMCEALPLTYGAAAD